MEYTKKLIYQSNYWYNDGLAKANIRDMSGAMVSLRRSLQYNRENIAARNLLGLVYFARGEVAEALVEWIISKNFKTHENIANYYIKKVQETPSELEAMNQAIRKFNQCLIYCDQSGEDLAIIQLKKVIVAHPTFLKAYQLLALLYLQTEQYPKARQVLRKAHKLDTTNETTLRYMHELTTLHNQKAAKLKEDKEQTVTYNLGNETIIQPVSASLKDNAATLTILNIIIGIAVGAAVIWFLIMPGINQSKEAKTNQKIVEYSNQIAAKNAEISALEKELEEFRDESEATAEAKATAQDTQKSYESFLEVYETYLTGEYGNESLAKELVKLNADSLGDGAQVRLKEMRDKVYPKVTQKRYKSGKTSYEVENYKTAIESLELVTSIEEDYDDGGALLALAKAYKADGNEKKATEKFNRVIELHPDSDVAKEAEEELQGMSGSNTDKKDAASDES